MLALIKDLFFIVKEHPFIALAIFLTSLFFAYRYHLITIIVNSTIIGILLFMRILEFSVVSDQLVILFGVLLIILTLFAVFFKTEIDGEPCDKPLDSQWISKIICIITVWAVWHFARLNDLILIKNVFFIMGIGCIVVAVIVLYVIRPRKVIARYLCKYEYEYIGGRDSYTSVSLYANSTNSGYIGTARYVPGYVRTRSNYEYSFEIKTKGKTDSLRFKSDTDLMWDGCVYEDSKKELMSGSSSCRRYWCKNETYGYLIYSPYCSDDQSFSFTIAEDQEKAKAEFENS